MEYKILTILLICAKLLSSQLYFVEKYVNIYSTKNIQPFLHSTDELGSFLGNIKQIEQELNMKKKDRYTMLGKKAKLCRKDGNKKLKIARTLYKKACGKRVKHGIPLLGEIWATLSDSPSPSAWQAEKNLVTHLQAAVSGEHNELVELNLALGAEVNSTKALLPEFELLKNESISLKTQNDAIIEFIYKGLELDKICAHAMQMGDFLIHEAEILENIKESSLRNLPNELLFPFELIFEELEKATRSYKMAYSQNFIKNLFLSSKAVTHLENSTIHSMVRVPVINTDERFEFIFSPNLNKEDSEILTQIEKIIHKKLDTFLCDRLNSKLIPYPSADLQTCLQSPKKDMFFCPDRFAPTG